MAKVSERQMAAFKKLGYSDAQIEEMIEDDKAVDRNEPLPWDMSKEEHKKAMKYANADEHKKPVEKKSPTVYNWNTDGKKRTENVTKVELISALAQFLTDNENFSCENVAITNKQGKVEFTVGDNSFSFSLTQHRKK
jgi:Fic family protein